MNYLIIQADQGKQRINKNVYGHFAEHLGRCIYRGAGSEKAHPFLIKEIQFDAEKMTTVLPPISVCACAIRVVPKK